MICTNTIHKVYPQISKRVHVPLLHIADAAADQLEQDSRKKVALLGTRYTMNQDFYRSRLAQRGFDVLIPPEADIPLVNSVIFDELCAGQIKESSRQAFSRIIAGLKDRGAEAVILGCTEIGLLIHPEDSVLPVYDTTMIHAQKAAQLALENDIQG